LRPTNNVAFRKAIVVAALARDIHAIVEKPLTAYFGDGFRRPLSVDGDGACRCGQGAESSTSADDLR
jgi:hypothetical protein